MSGQETFRSQRLTSLDDKQVLDVQILVFGSVEILLGDEDSLLEEVLVDGTPVGLGNDHTGPVKTMRAQREREKNVNRTKRQSSREVQRFSKATSADPFLVPLPLR